MTRLAWLVTRSALVLVSVVLVSATAARAHSEYERSEPAADARIPRAPSRVDVWFTQELFRRSGANTLTVHAPDGRRVDDGVPVIDDSDRTHLSVGVTGPLAPGGYHVTWSSLSALDGDTAEGFFAFTIDPSAPEPTASSGAPATGGVAPPARLTGGGDFRWWFAIAVPAVLASGVLVSWAIRAPFDSGPK
jgi:copper resistance protein C